MLINTSSSSTKAQPETTAPSALSPSPEQLAICDHVAHSARNLVVDASPGSGKSTTIAMAARTLPLGKLYVAMAFNKNAAAAFVGKLPHHVQSGTWHSVCLAAVRNARPRLKVKADKVKFLIKDSFPDVGWQQVQPMCKLVSLLKQQVGQPDLELATDLADAFGIELEPSAVMLTLDVLEASNCQLEVLDFDDMLCFALHDDVKFPKYGLVFVDEAQDTNAVQRAILSKMAARTVCVGDPYQSIYGFRGASHSAMEDLQEDLNAEVLPLSVSYRCPQAVVVEAQRILRSERFNLGVREYGAKHGPHNDMKGHDDDQESLLPYSNITNE